MAATTEHLALSVNQRGALLVTIKEYADAMGDLRQEEGWDGFNEKRIEELKIAAANAYRAVVTQLDTMRWVDPNR